MIIRKGGTKTNKPVLVMGVCTCSPSGVCGNSYPTTCFACKNTIFGSHYGNCPAKYCAECRAKREHKASKAAYVKAAGQKFRGYGRSHEDYN